MIILGLDPGIARTGFGVIEKSSTQYMFIKCGCITTPAGMPTDERLSMLGNDLTSLIAATNPDKSVIEKVFFGNNKKTALQTAHTRGVIIYILRQHNIETQGLTPLQIKSQLTGYGNAPKQQVQTLVQQQLNLNTPPKPDDAADALAAALCAH